MASPSRKLEERLAALKAMERSPEPPETSALVEALRSKSGLLVAAAARIVEARELRGLSGELADAFERLAEKPVDRDPGCRGKIAVARALRALDPKGAVPFLASLLGGRDERASAAALALGESRLAAARPHLAAWCERGATPDERRSVGYLALALLRDDAATELLLRVVREEDAPDAVAAAKALATFRDDPALAARLRAAADGRESGVVRAVEAALR